MPIMDSVRRVSPNVSMAVTNPALLAAAAALFAAANLAAGFPGEPGPDSQSQYAQVVAGQLDDWHPPIMAWLWSALRLVADGDAPMFSFQVSFYWLGFGLIAFALARAGRAAAAWVTLGAALFPPFLALNIVLLKDVGMAVTFLAAFAAVFWHRVQGRDVPPAIVAATLLLLLYGALVRANAVFAVVPLFAYLVHPRWLGRPWRLLALSLPVALALVPAANLVNQRLLDAQPFRPIRALQIFDITGIAFHSADLAVFGPGNGFTRDEVTRCYVPTFWDRLSPWGECRFFWNRLAVARDQQAAVEKLAARGAMAAAPNPDLPDLWIKAIIRHPLAYARHRLAHFASEVSRGASNGELDLAVPRPPAVVLYDWVTASALWLAIGAVLLTQLVSARALHRTASRDAALALTLSALPYAGAYLIIGVATEMRYLLWSLMAISVATVIWLSTPRRA